MQKLCRWVYSSLDMVTNALYIAILLLLLGCAPSRAQEIGQSPFSTGTIRVNVNRINVSVTVTDSHSRSVPGLQRKDFRIFDNGAEQTITGFVPSEEPARLVFLVERSSADYLLVKFGKSPFLAADNLLKNISAIDRVAIVTFSQNPQLVLDFTTDKLQARSVLQGVNSDLRGLRDNITSGSLNLSSSIVTTIDWLSSFPGAKIIVLLSTGIDTSPLESRRLVESKLKTSDVRILALSMFGDFRKPAKHKKLSADERADQAFVKEGIAESDDLLREFTGASGGHAYFPKDLKDFQRAYSEMAELVRSQYTLEFAPPAYDGKIHAISVRIRHSGYRSDYRQAYLAPASTER